MKCINPALKLFVSVWSTSQKLNHSECYCSKPGSSSSYLWHWHDKDKPSARREGTVALYAAPNPFLLNKISLNQDISNQIYLVVFCSPGHILFGKTLSLSLSLSLSLCYNSIWWWMYIYIASTTACIPERMEFSCWARWAVTMVLCALCQQVNHLHVASAVCDWTINVDKMNGWVHLQR